jgi:hypothetical protein
MYVEFSAYVNREEDMYKYLQKALKKEGLEHYDWGQMDFDTDENNRKYCTFYLGSDELYDDDDNLIDDCFSDAYNKAEQKQTSELYNIYVSLCNIEEKGLILNCWINDGSQFGTKPPKQMIINQLKEWDSELAA